MLRSAGLEQADTPFGGRHPLLPSLIEEIGSHGGEVYLLLPSLLALLPGVLNVLEPDRGPAYAQPPARRLLLGLEKCLVGPAQEFLYQRVRVIAGFDGVLPAFDADLD
jgi:hypothetical protein